MKEKRLQCDVLCVGGGIAGLMAAIHAREMGVEVVVLDKSNTLRSGAAGMGNDHFVCYIPEVHNNFDDFLGDLHKGQMSLRLKMMDKDIISTWFNKTHEIVEMWSNWGIPMKYHGEYEFAGHAYPGRTRAFLKYSGENQKVVLTREALNKGVKIINRAMVFDLLQNKDKDVIGAIAVNTREPEILVVEAKSVILGTGCVTRLYPSPTPAYNFNRADPVMDTGDGRMMAFRAGAPLANLEMTPRHAGPKYLARCGQATWIGVLKDRFGVPVGPFINKPERIYGDITTELNKNIFEEYIRSGRGPVYMDMNGISDEDYEYMQHWMSQEGNLGLLNHLKDEGVNLKNSAVEFMTYEMQVASGLLFNAAGETAIRGLHAAGDEGIGGISAAATFGWLAGKSAAEYSKSNMAAVDSNILTDYKKRVHWLEEVLERRNGPVWQEFNIALEQIMFDYCGNIRSAILLDSGLDLIRRIQKKAYESLTAANPHELMRCLEIVNLLELGELVMIGATDRKETRLAHKRSDFALTNPLLEDKRHIIKQVKGKVVATWEMISG
jgi:succinate dehydrogenase/fumarate reductase flavoprotein subunit